MDRRTFIRSLVAAAVAAGLPSIPSAEAATTVETVSDVLARSTLNGAPPYRVEITDKGDGWMSVHAFFEDQFGMLDFTDGGRSEGLRFHGEGENAPRAWFEQGASGSVLTYLFKQQ